MRLAALASMSDQTHHDNHEDQREGRQDQRECDLVWRALAASAVDERDHLVEKRSPGPAEMRTMIRSDSTVVPPVTPDRSPPASRITGANSPVIAASLTTAPPSITSPSPGMTWFASTTTLSPVLSAAEETCSTDWSARRRKAGVATRVLRSVSAWALPRSSATAVAKLGEQDRQPQPDVEGDEVAEGDMRS